MPQVLQYSQNTHLYYSIYIKSCLHLHNKTIIRDKRNQLMKINGLKNRIYSILVIIYTHEKIYDDTVKKQSNEQAVL